MDVRRHTWYYSVGGGQGGLNLPLPVPFNPGSRPVFFGSGPFAFFRLRNIAQCCVIFPFFSRFLPPWESRFPPPLLPPPVYLPPPFLPVSHPPVPPPHSVNQDNPRAQSLLQQVLGLLTPFTLPPPPHAEIVLPKTWRRTVEREIKDRWLRSWAEAATAAKERTTWKERACGPIPRLGKHGN